MSEIADVWFPQALQLEVGQAIYIRCASKAEQTVVARELEELREQYEMVDPELAAQLFVTKKLQDMKQYVIIERKHRAPFTAFFKDKDGNFSKISVDPGRKRMIKLMIKDGHSRQEIEDTLNGLTENEIQEFFPEK